MYVHVFTPKAAVPFTLVYGFSTALLITDIKTPFSVSLIQPWDEDVYN